MNKHTYLIAQLDLGEHSQDDDSFLFALLALAESLDPDDNTSGNKAAAFIAQLRAVAGDCPAVRRFEFMLNTEASK